MFAKYASRETQVRYYLGAWYIVRHDMHPHTHLTQAGPVTKQGHRMLVGIRQGEGNDDHGFTMRQWQRPDTEPRYTPAGYAP